MVRAVAGDAPGVSSNVIAMPRADQRAPIIAPIRVLFADGQWLVRAGLRAILGADGRVEVVAVAVDRDTVVRHAVRLRPDVIVLDAALNAIAPLVEAAPRSRLLLVTESESDAAAVRALRAGAAGTIAKSADPARLVEAVRAVAAGSAFVAPHLARRMLEGALAAQPRPDPVMRRRFATLSERELDVVRLLARGMSNAEIAGELYLSEGTVKTYVTRTLNKLRLRSRVQVVVAAFDAGLVRPGEHRLA